MPLLHNTIHAEGRGMVVGVKLNALYQSVFNMYNLVGAVGTPLSCVTTTIVMPCSELSVAAGASPQHWFSSRGRP